MSFYFDNAATTKMDSKVYQAMLPYLSESYFNPSSLYKDAKKVAGAVEESRCKIASAIGADAEEVVFTSGGTESNNMAIKGVAWKYANQGRHLITSNIEHHSVLNTFKWLESQGFEVTYLPVNSKGVVEGHILEQAITKETILISIMWVNNEIGSINPIKELAQIAHKANVLFHTDAVQAMNTQLVNVKDLGIDLMSFSGHKIYGPKGIGGLYCRQDIELVPLIHGGEQERGKRAGTEATALIVGFGVAVEHIFVEKSLETKKLKTLKARCISKLSCLDGWVINGDSSKDVPSILNIGFKGVGAEGILLLLNRDNIYASMGAACNTKYVESSYVLKAMGVSEDYLEGCIRLSFGKYNTVAEVETITSNLIKIVKRLRG